MFAQRIYSRWATASHFDIYVYDISPFIHSLPLVPFFFLLPAIPYRGLSSRNVAFTFCCRKIQILSRVCKNIPRSRRFASVGLLWISHSLTFSLFFSLSLARSCSISLSSCFSAILGRVLGGISSGEDATFRINRPVGLKPVLESRNGGSLAHVFVRAATRRDQCVMQMVTKKKIGWKRNPYPCPKTKVRRRWKEPSNDKRKLASSFCPPTSLPPPSVRRIFNGKIMRGIYSREFPPWSRALCNDTETARER